MSTEKTGWIESIPTVYRGVQMRSRAEADFARFLDICALQWAYESTSVLLEDGTHYRPDFSIGHDVWFEVRGYHTPESNAQLQSVARAVASGKVLARAFACINAPTSVDEPSLAAQRTGIVDAFYGRADVGSPYWAFSICTKCSPSQYGVLVGFPITAPCEHVPLQLQILIWDGYVSFGKAYETDARHLTRVRDLPDYATYDDVLNAAASKWASVQRSA